MELDELLEPVNPGGGSAAALEGGHVTRGPVMNCRVSSAGTTAAGDVGLYF